VNRTRRKQLVCHVWTVTFGRFLEPNLPRLGPRWPGWRAYLRELRGLPAACRAMPALPDDAACDLTILRANPNNRDGTVLAVEHGRWVVRASNGWRSWRWPSKPRHIAPADLSLDDEDAACDWAMNVCGIGQ
jgi:hypothetical protein